MRGNLISHGKMRDRRKITPEIKTKMKETRQTKKTHFKVKMNDIKRIQERVMNIEHRQRRSQVLSVVLGEKGSCVGHSDDEINLKRHEEGEERKTDRLNLY